MKKGIDADQQRRRRDAHLVEIRRKKAEEQASKRRDVSGPHCALHNRMCCRLGVGQSFHLVVILQISSAEGEDPADAAAALAQAQAVSALVCPIGARSILIDLRLQLPNDVARYAHLVIHGPTDDARLEGAQSFRKLLSAGVYLRPQSGHVSGCDRPRRSGMFWLRRACADIVPLAEKHPPIDLVISHGVLPYLVAFLRIDTSPKLQFESAWCLTNVASGTSQHTQQVIQAGAVQEFVRLLQSPHEDVREQATWALGNIAGDSTPCRDLVLQLNALPAVVAIIEPKAKLSVLRNAVWTLSNLCRGKPEPDFRIVGQALPILAAVIHSQDADVLTDALWALSYLSDGPDARVSAVLEAGVLHRVIELLGHPQPSIVTPALRTVGNIVTGDESQTQAVLNAGGLPHLLRLLTAARKALRKEACWTISNIMAGTVPQIQAVLDSNIIQVLVQILRGAQHGESDVRKEATWAICNGSSCGTPDQIAFMVQMGVVPLLAQQLITSHDGKLVGVILEGIDNILKSGTQNSAAPAVGNPYVQLMEEAGVPRALLDTEENNNLRLSEEVHNRLRDIHETYFDADGLSEEEGEVPGGGGAVALMPTFPTLGAAPVAGGQPVPTVFGADMQQQQQQQGLAAAPGTGPFNFQGGFY